MPSVVVSTLIAIALALSNAQPQPQQPLPRGQILYQGRNIPFEQERDSDGKLKIHIKESDLPAGKYQMNFVGHYKKKQTSKQTKKSKKFNNQE